MICLTHIPKTGGTTFRHILINNYSFRHVDIPLDPRTLIVQPNLFPLNSVFVGQIRSLSGHRLRFSDEIKSKFPSFKFTVFLRDPILRIISLYFHIQRYENPAIKFRDWVSEKYTDPILSNFQTRFISGSENLSNAKTILKSGYFFVGTTDSFDKSLLILKRLLVGNLDIRYEKKRSSKISASEILDNPDNKESLDKLRNKNELDLRLFDFVETNLFTRYQNEFGYISENELIEFKKSNNGGSKSKINHFMFKIIKYLFWENMFRIRKQ
ncbi:sulfotransferase family 2 domain-containing protein [uncultured Desulfosarcina sp.]|uniref:sulfotransferase family 2 domain-containing protein n=1 Tax=uncultured Desulfosarcina sp. TaxID=218289 RepID=UPI002D1E497C|nr:sulfotransferase family 2 domain-containing protein [uncultured Desulfosarcina sp.]